MVTDKLAKRVVVRRRDGSRETVLYFYTPSNETRRGNRDNLVREIKAFFENRVGEEVEDISNSSTNFFAVDENGTVYPAINYNGDVAVMYSVPSPDGKYLYVAFDIYDWSGNTRNLIAQYNCTIFKVSVENGTFTCLDPGYAPQNVNDWYSYYMKKSSSDLKPIQIDNQGNVYYLGAKFTCDEWGWCDVDWNTQPVIRKVSPDGTAQSITPDVLSIQSFVVTKTGYIVYTYYDTNSGKAGIKMYDPQTNSTNELTPDDAYSWWSDCFFFVDDLETVIYGYSASYANPGIYFAQRSKKYPGGRYVTMLKTDLFGSSEWNTSPVRVIKADDGNLYGLFEDCKDGNYTLKLYQILPYDGVPKVKIKLGKEDWWTYFANLNYMDVQISKGFAYYVEKESHPAGAYSDRTVIKMVNLNTGELKKFLGDDDWKQRYEIYFWKYSNDVIHFAGFDLATSKMVSGTIDTEKVKQGASEDEFLKINEVTSVVAQGAKIRDLEVLEPKQPEQDPGDNPRATIYVNSENPYSVSIKFNKYMDKESVNQAVKIVDNSTGDELGGMKVWFYKALHIIVDADGENGKYTVPFSYNETYTISIDQSMAKDAYGWYLACDENNPCSKNVTIRPETGWWLGVDEAVAGLTNGKVGKLALPSSEFTRTLFSNATSKDFSLSFAVNMKNWGEIKFVLKGNCTTDWGGTYSYDIFNFDIYDSYSYGNYYGSDGKYNWYDSSDDIGYISNLLYGWRKVELSMDNGTMVLKILDENGNELVNKSFEVGNPYGYTCSDYSLEMTLGYEKGDVFYFDNFVLTHGGTEIVNATFDSEIPDLLK